MRCGCEPPAGRQDCGARTIRTGKGVTAGAWTPGRAARCLGHQLTAPSTHLDTEGKPVLLSQAGRETFRARPTREAAVLGTWFSRRYP